MAGSSGKMLKKWNRILHNPCTIRSEMCRILHSAAEPARPGEGVAAAILRAVRKINDWGLDLSYSRGRSIWYQKADVWAHEADALRAWKRARDEAEMNRLLAQMETLKADLAEMEI